MIRPEDIKIGDLVKVNRNCAFRKGTICTVIDMRSENEYKKGKGAVSLSAFNNDDDLPWGTWCIDIEGIPLTLEHLEKNGFKEEVVGKYYTKPLDNEEDFFARYLAVERKSGNCAVFIKYRNLTEYALLRKIQYVHELQHILWVLDMNAELKV